MLKVNNKSSIERRHWLRSGVFIVFFEHISQIEIELIYITN